MRAQSHLTMLVILLTCSGVAFANTLSEGANNTNYELYHKARFNSHIKGIYISQQTLEDRKYLQYLIKRSVQTGINTFVIDLNFVSHSYEKNIMLVKNAGITYVARIVVFPFGSDRHKMRSEAYWMTRYK